GGAQLSSAAPQHLSGLTYRFFLSAPLQAGHDVITFLPGAWSWIDHALSGETTTQVTLGIVVDGDASFIVHQGPIAIIVPFPEVPAGYQVVAASLSDFDEFTLGGAGLGTVAVDQTVAPVLVDATHVRYAVTGAFASAGEVTATFKRGTWSVVQTGPTPPPATPDPSGPDVTTTLGSVEDPAQTFVIFGVA